ncbi:MAG: prenyltransferase, partial [Bacteroidales bacterium]|nr:prenyltransferase [Bacteroidales bacterium]
MTRGKKSTIKKWFANARDVSVAQSLLPSVLAVVLAISTQDFCTWAALLAVVGVVTAHMGMNLADDYFDYRVDMLSDREKV